MVTTWPWLWQIGCKINCLPIDSFLCWKLLGSPISILNKAGHRSMKQPPGYSDVECGDDDTVIMWSNFSALQWQWEKINQTLASWKTPHISPSLASYGVSIVRILEKINRVITASHCSTILWPWVTPKNPPDLHTSPPLYRLGESIWILKM